MVEFTYYAKLKYIISTWYLLIYLLRYLDQESVKGPFCSSSQAATSYNQSNHSKVEPVLLSTLPKDTVCELAG